MAPPAAKSWTKLACAGLALSPMAQAAITLDVNDPASVKSAASQIAWDMMSVYTGNQSGQVPGLLPAAPVYYYWWEAGAMFGGLVYYWYYTGDTSYNDVTSQALLFQVGEGQDYEPSNQTFDLGNDDQAFWAMSAMAAAEFNFPNPPPDQPQWLALAQAVFNRQADRWDTSTCGGGMRWQVEPLRQGYQYKNSIANGCFMNLAARLGKYTGNQTYIDWATKTYHWVQDIGLITPTYNVFDGTSDLQNCTSFNQLQWTYNIGVYLYATAVLWNVTQDSYWQGEVSNIIGGLKVFMPKANNVLSEVACEPRLNCNVDSQSYKAYIARWIADTIKVAPWTHDQLKPILLASATAAAKTCTGGDNGNFCGLSWVAEVFSGSPGVGEQLSAMEVIQSTLVDSVNGPLTHNQGSSKGDASAGSGADTQIVQYGPATTADKAGASILTILAVGAMLGGAAWLVM